ncbi:MAG: hypothetical protein RLZZ461_420 [Planctomycetota bacterium]
MVIGIVLAIGAVALPFTLREIDRRQEAETIDRLGLLVRLARAEARATGVPVMIRVDSGGRVIEARMLDPRDDGDVPAVSSEVADAAESPSFADDAAGRIMGTWSRVDLSDGLRLTPDPGIDDPDAAATLDDAAFGGIFDEDPTTIDDPDIEPWPAAVQLALFLPDGTAIATRVFGITTARGWRRCVLDPYGGRLQVEDPATTDLDGAVVEADETETMDEFGDFDEELMSPREETTEARP